MKRDWAGNTKSISATIGASNHSPLERAADDFYATNPAAIDSLAKAGKLPKNKFVLEPACGRGHLSKRLEHYGYTVISSDLVDRGYGRTGVDFFDMKTIHPETCILTNPPYKYCLEFAEHAVADLKADEYYAFHKLTFLEGQKRALFFKHYPPSEVLVFSKRMTVARNGDEAMFEQASAACYAWFIWRKGDDCPPRLGWI